VVALQDRDVRHRPQQRDALMHAFAAAEAAVGVLQVRMPREVSTTQLVDGSGFEVRLQFSEAPPRVREFATAYDVPVATVPHQSREGWSYTEATARIRGVKVVAWTLTQDET
jgi:hypothetical protein